MGQGTVTRRPFLQSARPARDQRQGTNSASMTKINFGLATGDIMFHTIQFHATRINKMFQSEIEIKEL
jgi:hypothetical protein